MTDPNLVRVLQAQSRSKVGLIDYKAVMAGEAAVRARIEQLRSDGVRIAIVDALSNDDLLRLGPVFKDMPLVTAGSGVAIGLPPNFGITASAAASVLPPAEGLRAVLSGSCSQATNRQVQTFIASGGHAYALDPFVAASGQDVVAQALAWAKPLLGSQPLLVYSTADSQAVKAVQNRLGVQEAGGLIEHTIAAIAKGLVDAGVRQLVVAGGETSGACVQALGIDQLQIGLQIAPGVPWCWGRDSAGRPVHIALKSGNFGADDFFTQAFTILQ